MFGDVVLFVVGVFCLVLVGMCLVFWFVVFFFVVYCVVCVGVEVLS